ncbi:MAG: PolC-type DNA polymerase III [Lachnospiraceae bacterium]|nr:PolC-type DNA polymerase III [Lachnospiraceae bacterium]
MEKRFFSVFPDLKLNRELTELFGLVEVLKITTNKDKSSIRVYILSSRLIDKKTLQYVESQIEEQLFNGLKIKVYFMEKFTLSGQYNLENLFEIYNETIMAELRSKGVILANMLRRAKCTFNGSNLDITIEETALNLEKENELREVLLNIFTERCGLPANITFSYREPEASKYRKQSDKKMELEIAAIVDRIKDSEDDAKPANDVAKADGADGKNAEASEDGKKAEAGKEAKEVKEAKAAEAKPKSGGYDNKGGYYRREKAQTREENPDVIYGRSFDGDMTDIVNVSGESGEVIIHGQIITVETREIRGERTIVMFTVSDFTDTIKVKIFMKNDQLLEVMDGIKKGAFVKLKGMALLDAYDKEVGINSVVGIMKAKDWRVPRVDTSVEKRVELHCHTKMSDMDGVSSASSLIAQAVKWGHKAIAITDHGNVQGFTDALHGIDDIKFKYKKEGKELDFKVLYGVEAYIVDDLKESVTNSKGQSLDDTYVVFDIETTGFSAIYDKIIEIGAVKVEKGNITERFSRFVNPERPIPYRIEELTKINDSMVIDADTIEKVLPEFLEFAKDCVLVAHNAEFDMSFIMHNATRLGYEYDFTYADTVTLARALIPTIGKYKLDNVAKALNIPLENHHRAVDDAGCTARIFEKFIEMLKERDINNLDELNVFCKPSVETIRKMPTHHAIIIATSEVGRINLYRIVSESHLTYFARSPRIPKSLFLENREGLIIGSACEAGELYQAVYGGKNDAEIARLVNFYDYLEIQPLGNNMFMVDKGEATVEDLIDVNKQIVKLGEMFNKPVVATCDVHFLNPEDEVYRRIIMYNKGFSDADKQAPLYLRTTDEMLEEFKYLGADKAWEVVITNPNKIADMCEKISPVHPDKAAPVIPNSDQMLRDICYNKAHEMYGDNLPEVVVERLERELNSIISNGFAVMYIIAQKLVWKSVEDGYLVGSRGSVGSSFVATMSGITEVNPLKPHYYCKKCHYSEFDSERVNAYVGGAGCDMPDANCPECGEPLVKAGFDIPFETFLGFKGNKEPDIDLNFSGEYQSKAHAYTEVIFGKGQTFRAGTIGTLAEKTAFGYVKHYFNEKGIPKRACEIERIAKGCVDVRRTTGQHPGGIIVLPYGDEIYKFTPVQHPANDMTTKTITTHFDYHSIDHNLLKLDILGHDDPTMIRMLEDLTGIDATTIPLDNQEVMSLFKSPAALGLTPADLDGCRLGSLGIPEFGTDFVIQMLVDTQPNTFSDLVRISGLSHGTDVWLGNAQALIEQGHATISTAICTRDDIMTYLINKGMDKELSFTIMESVRKGKGLKDDWEPLMLEAGVPEWYIWSCKKIKYMFPKAHAAAYVMMAFRIAYFKVFYPLAYYAAYFSIRAKAFSYEIMCQGKDKLMYFMNEYKKKAEAGTISNKESDALSDMKIVLEMYARGYEFTKIDIYKSHSNRFQIVDGKLLPSLNTIDGLGDNSAVAVVEAAKDGKFLSKDDFRQRTKVSTTNIELMSDLGLFGDLPDTNQLSLFDFV